MKNSAKPVSPISDLHERRAQFASLNPHLREEPGQYHCRQLWHLLTPRHRHGLPSCDPSSAQPWESECFLKTFEVWRDTLTGLPVMVMHLDCKHHNVVRTHEHSLNMLAERGLWYATSNASWVIKKALIVVIARADVIDRISLPNHLNNPTYISEPLVDLFFLPMTSRPEIHWEKRKALKLTEERVVRNTKASLAPEAESRGDYQAALEHYCETAYIDRSGGYHKTAQAQLVRARAVIETHSDLDVDNLRFENVVDQEFVFYNAKVMVNCEHLERRLSNVPLPPTWEPFYSHERCSADSPISGQSISGLAMIEQDDKKYLWRATVFLNDGPMISTVDDFCESPEAAAVAAIKLYHDYGKLLLNEGVPLAEVIRISGAFGEIQSAD